ncbi:MAG: hypothetical protein ACYC7A_21020 [Thermoanaerobaculia bacterium]
MKSTSPVLIYVISVMLALVAFGGSSFVAVRLQLPPGKPEAMAALFTIAPLLVGHYLAIHRKFDELEHVISEIPAVRSLRVFSNGTDAIQYVTSRLREAKKVYNTRVPPKVIDAYPDDPAYRSYQSAVRDVIASGTSFTEVVGAAFEPLAGELVGCSKTTSGKYAARVVAQPQHTFLNFIVMDFGHDDFEAVFGWAISSKPDFPDTCFATSETKLSAYLIAIFSDLYLSGEQVKNAP